MKQYDHEPTIEELLDQLEKEDMVLPDFLPKIKIPIIGKIIEKKMKSAMRDALANTMLT